MINIELWKEKSFQNINRFPCPHCNTGVLIGCNKPIKVITNEGKFNEKYNHPDGVKYIFSEVLKCNNEKCNDVVVVTGEYSDNHISADDEYGNPLEFNLALYQPKYFYPNLKFFQLGQEIPKNIKELINDAFALYFSDYSACANKIRTTIEVILDDLKIDHSYTNSKGEVKDFTLHKRIEMYEKDNSEFAKFLMALKIIGNEGSHATNTTIDNLLNAFEILEHFIESVYSKNTERINNLAKNIVEKK